jgi:hypothetical protein
VLEGGSKRLEIARSARLCIIANGPHSAAKINELVGHAHVD